MKKSGWIEVIAGCMFAGKTEELIRRVRKAEIAGQKVQVFFPARDTRPGGEKIKVHRGPSLKATSVESAKKILDLVKEDTAVVAIDEVQFFDWTIVDVCNTLADRGIQVILSGLDMDFRGEAFGPMPQLMAVAAEVDKLHAVCTFRGSDGEICGGEAVYTQRFVKGKLASWNASTIVVGAEDLYEARCQRHFQRPRKPKSR